MSTFQKWTVLVGSIFLGDQLHRQVPAATNDVGCIAREALVHSAISVGRRRLVLTLIVVLLLLLWLVLLLWRIHGLLKYLVGEIKDVVVKVTEIVVVRVLVVSLLIVSLLVIRLLVVPLFVLPLLIIHLLIILLLIIPLLAGFLNVWLSIIAEPVGTLLVAVVLFVCRLTPDATRPRNFNAEVVVEFWVAASEAHGRHGGRHEGRQRTRLDFQTHFR